MDESVARDGITMSQRERDVLKVMSTVLAGERTQAEAARLLRLGERQIRRLQRRLEGEGDAGIVHRLRGRVSNRRLDEDVRRGALAEYRRSFVDFGPTLASEKLAEQGLMVSPDTLRRWLLAEGLWKRHRRRDVHRSRRARRLCFGELVQLDTSIHDWLEGRGEAMVLVAMIDDATNRLQARFYEGETVISHLDLAWRWVVVHGRPLAVYTDRDSIFQAQHKGRGAEGTTQFGRALAELDIELILAYSPQAKGRVERFFEVAQDRWVKELRLAGVATRAEANVLLERRLLPEYNRRFTKPPGSPADAHRPLGPRHNPQAIFSVQHQRVVANDYTIRFENRCYQLHKPALAGLRGGHVTIELRLDGTMAIRFRDRYVAFHELVGDIQVTSRRNRETSSQADAAASRKNKQPNVAHAKGARTRKNQAVASAAPYRPPANHPWRRSFLKR